MFDAGAKTNLGFSLNEALLKGPTLQADIVCLLLNFRINPVAYVFDIVQAFLNIVVKEEFRNVMKFFWRSEGLSDGELMVIRSTRFMFGLTCSPGILQSVLQLHFAKFVH